MMKLSSKFIHMPWLGLLAICLSGCQTAPEKPQESMIEQELSAALEAETMAKQQVNKPPQDVQDAILPPMPEMNSGNQPEPRFDLSVNEAQAREFFVGLMQGSKWNVVLSPEVQGTISLDLKAVTVPLVMEIVRDTYGFEYQITENVYQVYPASLKTVIFPVNYL
ncbi:MAG: pilus (MSHA type) biogenesis protein MshL, partial [Gammaproteobacteria bacterium]|nr:pilus (MSHA type) biogenesis protein MshL [Gammaproteobacteria bacterium]